MDIQKRRAPSLRIGTSPALVHSIFMPLKGKHTRLLGRVSIRSPVRSLSSGRTVACPVGPTSRAHAALRRTRESTPAQRRSYCGHMQLDPVVHLDGGWALRPFSSIRSPVRSLPSQFPVGQIRSAHAARRHTRQSTPSHRRSYHGPMQSAPGVGSSSCVNTSPLVRSLARSSAPRLSRVGTGMPRPPPTTRTCRIRVVLLRRTRRPVSEHRCAALVIKIQSRSCSRTDPHVWVTVGGLGALGARCARARSLHVRWMHSLVRSLVRWLVRWFVRSFQFVRYLASFGFRALHPAHARLTRAHRRGIGCTGS